MSIRVMSAVWELTLPPSEKLVLLVIADHASDDGTNAWPSVATIARKAGLGERQARRILRALEDRGLLQTAQQAGGTPDYRADTRPNRYTVRPGGSQMSARQVNGGSPETARGVADDRNGGSPETPKPSSEPSNEPSCLPALPSGATVAVVYEGTVTAQTVVQAFVDEFREVHGATPPTQTLARIGRDARVTLERREYEPPVVVAAAKDAARFGHANLSSAIISVLSEHTRPRRGGPSTAQDRIAELMPLIEGRES